MAKSIALAAYASRLASLLLGYIPAVCAFVAPRQPGASTTIIDRLSHSRALSFSSKIPFAALESMACARRGFVAVVLGCVSLAACSSSSSSPSSSAGGATEAVGGGVNALPTAGQGTLSSSGGSSALINAGGGVESSTFGGAGDTSDLGGSGGSPAAQSGGAANQGAGMAAGGSAAGASAALGSLGGALLTTGGAASGGGPAGTCAAAFCEDFESGKFDPSKWTVAIEGSNTASVQSAKAAHGKYAALFQYAGTRNTWAMILAKLPASLRTHHFGRANVFFQTALPGRHAPLVTAGTTGFPNSYSYLEVAAVSSNFQVTFVNAGNAGGGEDFASGGTYPSGRWFCLGWEFNDTPDEVKVAVDGTQVFAKSPFSFMGKTSGLVGGFSDFSIGFRLWGSGPGDPKNDLYYDDIALDPQPLPCTP